MRKRIKALSICQIMTKSEVQMKAKIISDAPHKCKFTNVKCTDKCRHYKTCIHSMYKKQK